MAVIVLALGGVSLFSNYQRAHIRDIEKVTVGPAPSPIPAPNRTPAEAEQ